MYGVWQVHKLEGSAAARLPLLQALAAALFRAHPVSFTYTLLPLSLAAALLAREACGDLDGQTREGLAVAKQAFGLVHDALGRVKKASAGAGAGGDLFPRSASKCVHACVDLSRVSWPPGPPHNQTLRRSARRITRGSTHRWRVSRRCRRSSTPRRQRRRWVPISRTSR